MTHIEHTRPSQKPTIRHITASSGFECLDNENPFDLTKAVRTANGMIISDDVSRAEVDDGQNNQSHNPDATICVRSSLRNGAFQSNQGAGRTEYFPIASVATRGFEQSKLPKLGTSLPWFTGSNLEPLSPGQIKKRKLDEDISRSTLELPKPNPDPGLLANFTTYDTNVPNFDLTEKETNTLIHLIGNKAGTAKIPFHPQFPVVTQQGQARGNPIPFLEQKFLVRSTIKAELTKALWRLQQNQFNMMQNKVVLQRLWEAGMDLRDKSIYNDAINLRDTLREIEDKTTEAIAMLRRQFRCKNQRS